MSSRPEAGNLFTLGSGKRVSYGRSADIVSTVVIGVTVLYGYFH